MLFEVSFKLDEEQARQLQEMMSVTGIKTHRDCVNNAMVLLLAAVNHVRRGKTVAALDERSRKFIPLILPALEEAAKHPDLAPHDAEFENFMRSLWDEEPGKGS